MKLYQNETERNIVIAIILILLGGGLLYARFTVCGALEPFSSSLYFVCNNGLHIIGSIVLIGGVIIGVLNKIFNIDPWNW